MAFNQIFIFHFTENNNSLQREFAWIKKSPIQKLKKDNEKIDKEVVKRLDYRLNYYVIPKSTL